jgi:hypothetical protein
LVEAVNAGCVLHFLALCCCGFLANVTARFQQY